MTQLLRYCKAYPAKHFQEFANWPAQEQTPASPARSENGSQDSGIDDYWFLHENYVVTRGIVVDEDVIFDQVSPGWIEFCRTALEFKIPDDLAEGVISEESNRESHATNTGA
jgi:hypothetical protein